MGTRPRTEGSRKRESTQPRARLESISHQRQPVLHRRTLTEVRGGRTVCTSKCIPGPPRTFNDRVVREVNASEASGTMSKPTKKVRTNNEQGFAIRLLGFLI